ncbi:MAG: hypothetical protein NC392_09290 [Roseburia sp.]|nr:hypothetical protein [Roseburia sp.]
MPNKNNSQVTKENNTVGGRVLHRDSSGSRHLNESAVHNPVPGKGGNGGKGGKDK